VSRPPLGFALAAAWTLAALLSFQLLAATVAALRPGAPLDVVAGCACQAAAFLLVLYGLLSVHAPDAPLPHVDPTALAAHFAAEPTLLEQGERGTRFLAGTSAVPLVSFAAVPLRAKQRLVGFVAVASFDPKRRFDEGERKLLSLVERFQRLIWLAANIVDARDCRVGDGQIVVNERICGTVVDRQEKVQRVVEFVGLVERHHVA
jgi:hypothetical protein